MSENSSSDISCTPPEIAQAAYNATFNLLPEKSKFKYEKQYQLFVEWCTSKKVKKFSESVLLAYFTEKSKILKSSTMWSVYSMLRSTLVVKNDVDISVYKKLIAYLKRQSVGYRPKKSKTFSKEEIFKFLVEASDEQFLMMKVVMVIGVFGACRRDEIVKLSVDDIQDKDSIIIVNLPNTKTNVTRTFVITNNEQASVDILALVRKYISLRPTSLTSRRFFVRYTSGKCASQVVGVNIIGKIPSLVAQYLNLPNPEMYTGHTFRRSSATLLANAGEGLIGLKRHGGWKSTSVVEGYIDDSINNKVAVAQRILSDKNIESQCISTDIGNTSTDPPKITTGVNSLSSTSNDQSLLIKPGFNITNCKNCTFSFNIVNNYSST